MNHRSKNLPGRSAGWSWKLSAIYFAAALAIIAVADYAMGDRAQGLNGYEILRRTFAAPLGIDLPVRSERFVIRQEAFGGLALAWGWLLSLLWAAVLTRFLYILTRRFFKKRVSAEEAFFGNDDL